MARNVEKDRRTIAFEVGMQNGDWHPDWRFRWENCNRGATPTSWPMMSHSGWPAGGGRSQFRFNRSEVEQETLSEIF
jgi:hypothetical protein